ncbi:hypothetical protein BB558_004196 [Smittium angustum]|uniref:Citrate transporter-like domain-containing protein n=1 Tax=Smittium angustum TaxID=133377 RepID=A0A2U1J431_SMIAN|nr:hypothetical protein BB558_004196 [Smittium angustum]
MFAVFCGTICGIITSGYPISVVASIAVAVLSITNNLICTTSDGLKVDCHLCGKPIPTQSVNFILEQNLNQQLFKCVPINSAFEAAISGFSSDIPWLVFSAFHIGKAVQVTQLGHRAAFFLISYLDSSLLGIGYSICGAELLLSPFIPSNTARGGGIVFPVVKSIIDLIKLPEEESGPVYAYLTMIGGHSNSITSSLFVTSMAGNPLVASTAEKVFGIKYSFTTWALGCFVPGLFVLLVVPLIANHIYKPKFDTTLIRQEIVLQKSSLGPLSIKEWKLILILALCLVLWAGSSIFKIGSTIVAFSAILSLLLLDILVWNDIASNSAAWDTFYWLSIFFAFANQLSELGISAFIGKTLSFILEGTSPIVALVALSTVYYFSTYMFSSTTSHIVALVGPFMSAAKELNCNPFLFTAVISSFSTISACLAPYCCGCLAIYASLPYVKQNEWFYAGILSAGAHFLIFTVVGIPWYWAIGWL